MDKATPVHSYLLCPYAHSHPQAAKMRALQEAQAARLAAQKAKEKEEEEALQREEAAKRRQREEEEELRCVCVCEYALLKL